MNKVPIKITATKTNKRDKKSDPSKWYVHKTKILLAAMFYKTAGGVGREILEYLLFMRSVQGKKFISHAPVTIPNEWMWKYFAITKQRKADALMKLEAAGLIICTKEVGKSTLVKLNVSEELLLDD